MGFTLRFWGELDKAPGYEVSDMGEIRKIGDEYQFRIPQFWGKLDNGDPQWMVTLLDEEGKEFTTPVYELVAGIFPSEGKYEN